MMLLAGMSGEEEMGGSDNDIQWAASAVDSKVRAVLSRDWKTVRGAYGEKETEEFFDTLNTYTNAIKGKNVLVVSIERDPWVEAITLAIGASHVTVVSEYHKIKCDHPQVRLARNDNYVQYKSIIH